MQELNSKNSKLLDEIKALRYNVPNTQVNCTGFWKG